MVTSRVIQRAIRVGTNTLEDKYTKSYEELETFEKIVDDYDSEQEEANEDQDRLSDLITVRKAFLKNKGIDFDDLYISCEDDEHQAKLKELVENHNKRVDIAAVNQLMEKPKITESDDFEFTCQDAEHQENLRELMEKHNAGIEAAIKLILNKKEIKLEH